ncbi:MAG: cytochrome c3 family protein [Planctomycetes bacterium]|nr:cytochrome c3 family protein [Planctomycetota bacterium]
MAPLHSPRWIDRVRPIAGGVAVLVPAYFLGLLYLGGSPYTTDVGYEPIQPVPFSHAQHAGDLGIDCRYCHTTVETAARAAIPPTATCMNCHLRVGAAIESLELVRQSYSQGTPIHWIRVHDLPDFAYFDHSAHVSRGVGCVSCHGRVDRMERVSQVEPLSMGWCLDCHRHPEPHLRPKDKVTDMDWVRGGSPSEQGDTLRDRNHIDPSTDCSTCH